MSRRDRVLQKFETGTAGLREPHWDAGRMAEEILRLEDRLDNTKCNSGHETLPLMLWDCPACHDETRAKLKQTDIDLGKAERRYEAAEEDLTAARREAEELRGYKEDAIRFQPLAAQAERLREVAVLAILVWADKEKFRTAGVGMFAVPFADLWALAERTLDRGISEAEVAQALAHESGEGEVKAVVDLHAFHCSHHETCVKCREFAKDWMRLRRGLPDQPAANEEGSDGS